MRIISGELKGRILHIPKNFRARPTTDVAREALFNVLSHSIDFENLTVLDLFSGSGLISFEFASRGCKNIISIEKDYHHHKFITEQIQIFNLTNAITSFKTDAFSYLKRAPQNKFDIVFADPPYDLPNFDDVLQTILESKITKKDGLIIIEHGPERDYSHHPNFSQSRKYGKVFFSFFDVSNDKLI